jgi:hypothetical protein
MAVVAPLGRVFGLAADRRFERRPKRGWPPARPPLASDLA